MTVIAYRTLGFRRDVDTCSLLGYYAASSGISVPTLEYGTDMLFRNVGTELPLNTA
jgi:hypothetical protein